MKTTLDLYGLAIAVVDRPDFVVDAHQRSRQADVAADIQWDEYIAPQLDDRDVSDVFEVEHEDGPWTRHVFADRATTFCEFDVSPDGRRVISRALPTVLRADVRDLFAESVMRTIFRRRGIVSFHGAALARDGACVLLLGAKRAGKSTLAGALVQNGWSLLTDDLARVVYTGGQWCVAPGYRQLKLSADTVEHLGFATRELPRRWSSPAASEAPRNLNKQIVCWDLASTDAESPLRAIYALCPRDSDLAVPCIETLPGIVQLRALMDNLTRDALTPELPSRESMSVVGSLLRQTSVRSLTMPDRLSGVRDAAVSIESCLVE